MSRQIAKKKAKANNDHEIYIYSVCTFVGNVAAALFLPLQRMAS